MSNSGTGPGNAAFHAAVIDALETVGRDIIVPRFNNLRKDDVRSKTHPGDLVTIADEEAEQRLTALLPPLVPDSLVVGEESAAADDRVLDLLAGDKPVWIIDPIDGTSNFVNSVPRFGVIVALVKGGETVMGWIHDPLAGHTIFAEQGEGAWVHSVSGVLTRRTVADPHPPLKDMDVALHPKVFGPSLGRFARNVRLGSAAHDYWAAAENRLQVLAYRKLKPWDHAAGVLIHAEAGGYNALLTGTPYRPALRDQEWLLCAPSVEIWNTVATMAADRK